MPSGDDAYEAKRRQMEARKALSGGGDGPRVNELKVKANTAVVIRPLEQGADLCFADVHRVPLPSRRGRYFKSFLCRNLWGDGTPCPLCQHPNQEISRTGTVGYINVIERNAPIFQRGNDGKLVKVGDSYVVIGHEDQIALWNPSWRVFEALKDKDRRYQGLMSRDWEVKREGSGPDDTKYFIEPAIPDGGPQPMTIADVMLAAKKYDLSRTGQLMTPLPYEALAELATRGAMQTGPQPTMDRGALVGQPTVTDAFAAGQTPAVHSSAFTRG